MQHQLRLAAEKPRRVDPQREILADAPLAWAAIAALASESDQRFSITLPYECEMTILPKWPWLLRCR